MSESRLADLLNLCVVPRWSVVPVSRPQTVAEHSFRVACITMNLVEDVGLDPRLSMQAVLWAMMHDGAEAETGDIPARFKRFVGFEMADGLRAKGYEVSPWLNDYKPIKEVAALVKIADLAEASMYLHFYGVGPRAKIVITRLDRDIEAMAKGLEGKFPELREAVRRVFSTGLDARFYWEDADGKKFNEDPGSDSSPTST